jgi:hypothetical protein
MGHSSLILLFIVLISLPSSFGHAGVIELGAQANYRSTSFDPSHTDLSESGTGSIGYYFWGLTALEVSYTRGASLQDYTEYQAYQDLTAYGVDLMITMADKDSALKPYVKLGAAYVIKDLREVFPQLPAVTVETSGISPSAGIGFKYMLTQQFALKGGFDISTSPVFLYYSNSPTPNQQVTYDFSANGGLSIFF